MRKQLFHCAGNKVFVKYVAQGFFFNPNPLRAPLQVAHHLHTLESKFT